MKTEQKENSRLRWINLNSAIASVDESTDIIAGLTQNPKTLPCRYFYDDRGSELFEQICDLPEYYPTRTEQAILETYAAEIAQMTGSCHLIELGSGSSRKTRLLLEAYSEIVQELQYYPIDVSSGILKTTALDLLRQYPKLKLCGLAGTYEQALAQLPPAELENRMLIFLGSTLGNLNDEQCSKFFTQVQQALKPGEFFLLGVDLQKPIEIIEAAYNDSQGITAAFNLNILNHHLRSLTDQTVVLEALDFQVSFQAGKTIRTEISRKFHIPTLISTLDKHALQALQVWTDPKAWFGLLLCQRQCTTTECP